MTKPTRSQTTRILLAATVLFCAATTLPAAEFHSNLQKSFAVSTGGKLKVEVDRGSIEVATVETDKVEVQVFRTVKDEPKEKADEIFAEHEVTFSQEGSAVIVRAEYKKGSRPQGQSERKGLMARLFGFVNLPGQDKSFRLRVRYQISVPKKFNADLKTFGGDITVAALEGEVRSETSGGALKLGHIQGPVWAKTFGGDITLAGSAASAEVSTSGGSIELGPVEGPATAQTFGGSIEIKSVQGKLSAKTSGGDITIDRAAAEAEAQTFGGTIKVKNAGSKLNVHTSGGRIEIGEAGQEVIAQTFGGSIKVKKAGGKASLKTSGGEIEVGEAHNGLEAKTFSGSITAALAGQPTADCRLETSGGDIKLRLADMVAGKIDAHASGGRVVTDIPMTVQGEQKPNALRAQLKSGGPALVLRANGGSIYLKRF